MSVKVVLKRRFDEAMSKFTFSILFSVAFPILVVGGIIYLSTLLILSTNAPSELAEPARTFAQFLLLVIETVLATTVILAVAKTVWDMVKKQENMLKR